LSTRQIWTSNVLVIFTCGHCIVDRQVMIELAMLSTVVVQVTELLAVATVIPLFSIVREILMLPHTSVVEHVYVTFSLAAATGSLTVQVGVAATEKQHCYLSPLLAHCWDSFFTVIHFNGKVRTRQQQGRCRPLAAFGCT